MALYIVLFSYFVLYGTCVNIIGNGNKLPIYFSFSTYMQRMKQFCFVLKVSILTFLSLKTPL